jgi:hypothetical protein
LRRRRGRREDRLIRRGDCTFLLKSQLAADAGAVAAIVCNNAPGPLLGRLVDPAATRIPVGTVSQADGAALVARAGASTTL